MTAIINAVLVMKDHYIPDGILLIEDGRIAECGSTRDISVPDGCMIIDAQGFYVGPGLIDIHTHADGNTCFHDDPVKCSEALLRHGVTSVLSAPACNMDIQEYIELIEQYKSAEAFDWDGDRTDTKLTLDVACRNMMVRTGCSVCDVFRYTSYQPSRLLNLYEYGEIKKGNIANLAIVDAWFGVKKTILRGELVAKNV